MMILRTRRDHQQTLRHFGDQDTRVAYRTIGGGPALLLIHGYPLHGLTFRRIVPDLRRDYTCVVVDLPGAGESVWGRRTDFRFPAQAQLLKQLMNHLGHRRYAVLGQDTGGSVARHLALATPEQVRKLILINTEIPHHRPTWVPIYQALLPLAGSIVALQRLLRLRAFRHSSAGFGGCFQDKRLIDGEFRALFIDPLIRDHRRGVGYARYLRCVDWAQNDAFATEHGRIACPVSLIWGRLDPTFPYERARSMVEQFPNCAGIEIIEGAKLLPHEEQPDAVVASIRGFLGT
jgi:pimeloyl-ACP methyl ester carboxylesterase